ncbi:MAG: diguanylate cyclase, partial [Firmicutes bacterium]|nr:diguanylate cyclase [Bacillota bacterium]
MDTQKVYTALRKLSDTATKRTLYPADFESICKSVDVCKMYYDIDLGYKKYTDPGTNKLIIADELKDGKIFLYNEEVNTGLKLKYTYYFDNLEYVHAYIEFREGIKKESLDLDLYQFLADQMYLIVSRQNIRLMLDYAENYDIQTSIPNIYYLRRFYHLITKNVDPSDYAVIFSNLRNLKYINQTFGVRTGDEVMIRFAHTIVDLIKNGECVSRMGGDNFVFLVKKTNLDAYIEKLKNIKISGLNTLPDKSIDISIWMGVSNVENDDTTISTRIEQASVACSLGKQQFKKPLVFYDSELAAMMNHSRKITAMFYPAAKNHEFIPFFQPKVNMLTGELIGLEALCRWKHDGQYIFPDQFIPVLDRQGLIHELDMAILGETCAAIRKWLDMGL